MLRVAWTFSHIPFSKFESETRKPALINSSRLEIHYLQCSFVDPNLDNIHSNCKSYSALPYSVKVNPVIIGKCL